MELKDYITKRKSTRSYLSDEVDESTLDKIKEFIDNLTPLYPHIKTQAKIVNRQNIKSVMSRLPPQILAMYSEEKDGMYENIGFMFQQLDLYLHSLNLGSCWVGLGKADDSVLKDEEKTNCKFVILIAFGHPADDSFRNSPSDFKRKSISDISDTSDIRLEPARLAPSAVNSQPWYFVSDTDTFHMYRNKKGIFMPKMLKSMNLIDTGIALAHMYVSYPDTFKFFKSDKYPLQKGCDYVGSFKI